MHFSRNPLRFLTGYINDVASAIRDCTNIFTTEPQRAQRSKRGLAVNPSASLLLGEINKKF
ncbi:hypothetical protein AT746_14405 [Lacimicrobium alkaliphilum]|uniref:Uncharacterized protein n=1 Tax=Lacimicrobium alkaliphilum TaxID=1526571 RepID=A0A0U2ZA55_9ALTE|nr:hypothetical protein AT746_14405 [Lacimicrobium alkaliphilum]